LILNHQSIADINNKNKILINKSIKLNKLTLKAIKKISKFINNNNNIIFFKEINLYKSTKLYNSNK